MSEVYQRGSIRKIERKRGNAVWEWRYRVSGVMKQETFAVDEFKTEKALWRRLEQRIKLLNEGDAPAKIVPSPIVTMGTVIAMYRREHLPGLAKSTRGTDSSMLDVHIEPRWGQTLLEDVKPMAVSKWLETLDLSAPSKGRAKRLLKQLIDKAIFWELIPDRPNPMRLVKVKGSTLREKEIVLVTIEQFNALFDALPIPFGLMTLTAACLGLRVSEVVALQWDDFNWEEKIVTIRRAFTHGELKETKTVASAARLPFPNVLGDALKVYQPTVDSVWLYPSPVNGGPRWGNILLQDHIRPVAQSLNLPHVGWHTLRHSYASWLSGGEAPLKSQKNAMRHSTIDMTMKYGGTPVEKMRPYVDAVGGQLHGTKTLSS